MDGIVITVFCPLAEISQVRIPRSTTALFEFELTFTVRLDPDVSVFVTTAS
jgi:hypothetical protein